MEKTIYGGKPNNPVGYCCLHCGLLTVKEMKRKNCLGKQCRHLKRFEDHEYWRQRRIAKEKTLAEMKLGLDNNHKYKYNKDIE